MPTPIRPIRLLISCWAGSKGSIIPAAAPGLARDMIASNLAEYVDAQPAGYIHRMMEPAKRKRGRPRKAQL